MNNEKTLYLLDGFALVYRAYFAFINNPRISSTGMNTSAVFGFTNTLLDVIQKRNPSHLAVVFDPKEEKSVRTTTFLEYKANRQEMPEDIRNSLPYIERMLDAFNIPLLVCEGYEADDVIGTMAQHASKNGYKVYIMSPDKDLAQLVNSSVTLINTMTDEKLDIDGVIAKFGVPPERIVDYLSIIGDAVDNVPGVPKAGPKTANK
eukprot:gene34843-biopygen25168